MSIEKVVDALNGAFAADPSAIHALIVNRVPCNQALADDPFVQVDCPPVLRDGLFQVGAIGLINGVLAAIGLPLAATMFSYEKDSDGRSKLIGFTVYKPVQSEVAAIQSPEPQPDQYWQHKKSGDRAYFIGRTPEGTMVWQCEGDNVEIGNLDWSEWEYLPGCDSWEWKSNPVPAAEQTFPLYAKDCCGMIFRADSPDRIFWLPIEGGEHLQEEPALHWAEWSDREPLTESEIGEIINRSVQAEVKPTSDVMCQSPDDWVPQVTMLPRTGIDQVKWTWNDGSITEWQYAQGRWDTATHGYCSESGGRLEVRCQRKHLGKVHNGIPVALYWYDGAIVGRYADSPVTDPSFVPIHSDGNGGWFIERSEDAGN